MTVSALALGSLCSEHYFYYSHRSTENTLVEFRENGKQVTYPLDRAPMVSFQPSLDKAILA